jgi:hypothetical protein
MSIATKPKVDLDQLRAREAELAERVEATRARLSEYSTSIAEARREAVYAGKARPGGELAGPVERLRKKERQDASALPGLEGDLSAVRSVIAEESARLAEAETAEARKQLEQLHEQEEGVYQRAGVLFASLADVWNELVEIIESEDQFVQANKLEGSGVLAVEPTPASFRAFLLLLHSAATDADVRAEPHTEQLVDSGIYGRRDENGNDIGGATYDTRIVGTRTLETRRRLDERDVLFNVVPDLRSVVRALSVSGRIPKFTSE